VNGWNLFTWLMAALLAGSALVIFVLFLRDARGILQHEERPEDRD
jgi:hypothetical protein